ncbi:MAG: molecular chaperone DnaK, partial [Chloroflexi bacterium]|nr:molecular chaperone DnaK [Chloroflexota bacterium]
KFLTDFGDQIPEEAKETTTTRIKEVREAQATEDVEKIKAATEALMQHVQTLGGQMYQQPDGAPAGGAAPGGADGGAAEGGQQQQRKSGQDGEDVVDAEFTEA